MSVRPYEKSCFKMCSCCGRCYDKGRYPEICGTCTGRADPYDQYQPDPDDYCDCRNGKLRIVTKDGHRIVRDLPGDPWAHKIQREKESQDEVDWQRYLKDTREKLGNEYWDPIQFDDGSSSDAWLKKHKYGI